LRRYERWATKEGSFLEFFTSSQKAGSVKKSSRTCKEYIAHRLFKSVDELKDLLEKLLNQGELAIQWQRKIKNKGNKHTAT
jgi:hypothetical protein